MEYSRLPQGSCYTTMEAVRETNRLKFDPLLLTIILEDLTSLVHAGRAQGIVEWGGRQKTLQGRK